MKKGAVGWVGVCLSLSGVAIQSFGPVRWGFAVFLVANALWFTHACRHGDKPLMTLQGTTAVLNVHALWRFFA